MRFHAVGQQLPYIAGALHFAGFITGFVTVAPEEIDAYRAFNGGTGVLRHNQAVEGAAAFGVGSSEEQRGAEGDVMAVNRTGVFAFQWGTECADRA